jgi:hypothetical protein
MSGLIIAGTAFPAETFSSAKAGTDRLSIIRTASIIPINLFIQILLFIWIPLSGAATGPE